MTLAIPFRSRAEAAPVAVSSSRPAVRGKFVFNGAEKLCVRGVTYGTFRPDANGDEFPAPDRVAADFQLMRANGVNALRTYTPPPGWLLDEADRHGLSVMVGLAAERLVGYVNDRGGEPEVIDRVRRHAARCAGHPAVLCYAVGNEIPAGIVRWFGRHRMERFIHHLCDAARHEDPHALVTYVNYPSTEYLQLPFLDLVAYNVYLESADRLAAYIARLQNIAGERPLVMAEIGLDSVRNGEEAQAASLSTQVRTAFAGGCAGAFVYAWTDEWHRGGEDVEDWAFGLTRRDRRAKPALAAARDAFAAGPFVGVADWPRVSVVVCSCNGAGTLRDCLDGLLALDYPDYEVIIVNDGSTDRTAAIASEYPFHLIDTPNRGLSSARNTGLRAAAGELVAYIDDDARPDRDWLRHLRSTFMDSDWAAVGGPNLAPAGDGMVADCIANAPGGPIHVLLSDREAEHIPGCNMAFRRAALEAIGGFDAQFRIAGDDVDVCWRLRERSLRIGFSPAAVVWHHRRTSVRGYLHQQSGYAHAEALLARKWPEKYGCNAHVSWRGRLYGGGLTRGLTGTRRWRVYYGSQGSGLFQSIYQPATRGLAALPLMPEWYLVIAALAAVSLLGVSWWPLLVAAGPLLGLAVGAVLVQAVRSAAAARFPTPPRSRLHAHTMRAMTAVLHLIQPLARLRGRLMHGLTPWRRSAQTSLRLPTPRSWAFWSTTWTEPTRRLRALESRLDQSRARTMRGGDYDPWDIEVRAGPLVRARVTMGVEDHAGGAQLMRVRAATRPYTTVVTIIALVGTLAVAAAVAGAGLAGAALGAVAATLLAWLLVESAYLAGAIADAVEGADQSATPVPARRRPGPAMRLSRRRAVSRLRVSDGDRM